MNEPFIFVIFGCTGDLTHRKLMPALYKLHVKKELPKNFACVGVARKDKTDDMYRKEILESLKLFIHNLDMRQASELLNKVTYFKNDFDASPTYDELKNYLEDIDEKHGTKNNRIFYLATLPEHFQPITENLEKHNIIDRKRGFHRLIIEKPFGNNLKSARHLNKIITSIFKESEIFRIDHYLGKETVQNLFVLRLGNRIFEPVWNSNHVENIQITVAESIGLEKRGNYYDKSGALRDMVQNHILQILSLVAMEPPKEFTTSSIKDEKMKVLKAIACPDLKCIHDNIVFGQYVKGNIGINYHDEQGVDKNSRTETYAALKFHVNNKRWKGTPFYIRTGKYMKRKSSEISVYFKKTMPIPGYPELRQNVLVIRLQPEEGLYLRFNVKEPGNDFKVERVSMDFSHQSIFGINTPEAYEKLLYDAFSNDSTLFTRWDEVEQAWIIVDPIITSWNKQQGKPFAYECGSWGPKQADELIAKEGHHWRLRDDK
ncbi:MAG: glucose-6-phosphate dehydrogenase [archaeon]